MYKCQNANQELTINKCDDVNENLYSVFRCGHKKLEPIYTWSANDILSMTSDEFMQKMYSGFKILPPNHDFKTYYYCKTDSDVCEWSGELDTVSVAISALCNIKCKMCDIISHKKIDAIDKIVYFDVLYKLKGHGLKVIRLTTEGEPFVYKEETFKYLETLTHNDCETVDIFTNTVLLTQDDIDRLYRIKCTNGIDIKILCSCSGITPETYSIVHNNNKFETVEKNIRLINSYGMLNCVNFVIMPDNLHELEFYRQFWTERGLSLYQITACVLSDYCYPGAAEKVLKSYEYKRYLEQLNSD